MSVLSDCLLNRNIRAVIFDLDDTLYPEIQYVESGFKAVSGQIKKDFGTDCYDLMLGLFDKDRKNVYNRTLDCCGINYDEAYIKKLINVYRNHTPNRLKFFPDVLPFINELKRRKIATGIITDGRVEGQRQKLSALGCYGLFDGIIITDELGGEEFRKPSMKAFEIMCSRFNVKLEETAYIGDNPSKDFYSGSKGVFTVRIKRTNALNLGGGEYYKGVKENLLIDSLI